MSGPSARLHLGASNTYRSASGGTRMRSASDSGVPHDIRSQQIPPDQPSYDQYNQQWAPQYNINFQNYHKYQAGY